MSGLTTLATLLTMIFLWLSYRRWRHHREAEDAVGDDWPLWPLVTATHRLFALLIVVTGVAVFYRQLSMDIANRCAPNKLALRLLQRRCSPAQPALAHSGEPPAPHDLWQSWPWEPRVIVGIALSAALYWRRGSTLAPRRTRPRRDLAPGHLLWEWAWKYCPCPAFAPGSVE
ncbi:MAG: hypothetical protein R2932_30705 [Caldilineaceae bacterium]